MEQHSRSHGTYQPPSKSRISCIYTKLTFKPRNETPRLISIEKLFLNPKLIPENSLALGALNLPECKGLCLIHQIGHDDDFLQIKLEYQKIALANATPNKT